MKGFNFLDNEHTKITYSPKISSIHFECKTPVHHCCPKEVSHLFANA